MTPEEIRARIEACHTADGIDHGRRRIEDCLNAVVERYEDGYILCTLNISGCSCDECMELFEKRLEREESDNCT